MKLRWFAFLLPVRLALGIFLILLAWYVWVFVRAEPKTLSVAERNAVRATVQKAVLSIRQVAPEGPLRIGVAHFRNDPTDAVTEQVKSEFDRLPDTTVETGSLIQKFLSDVGRTLREATSLDEVLHAARRVDLDVIVMGRFNSVETDAESGTQASLDMSAYDCRSGEWLHRATFQGEWRPNFADQVKERVLGLGALSRFLLWLAGVLALPWVTYRGTHWAMERRTNLASFLLILAYTAAGLLLAVVLSGFRIVGPAAGWRLLGGFIFSAVYNYWACEKIARNAK